MIEFNTNIPFFEPSGNLTVQNTCDIDTTGQLSGFMLKYDGQQWVPGSGTVASYGLLVNAGTFTGTPGNLSFDTTIVETPGAFSRVGDTITLLQNGYYIISYSVNLFRTAAATNLLGQANILLDGTPNNFSTSFFSFFSDAAGFFHTTNASNSICVPLPAGTTVQVQGDLVLGGETITFLAGSSLTILRIEGE